MLSLDEINNFSAFQDLVSEYFSKLKGNANLNITNVESKVSGIGPDNGKDIIVSFRYPDAIIEYERKWVIQCKFHNTNISPSHISDINIPTLIHSYNACGYLLICKSHPTSGLTNLFDNLNANCKFEYKYEVWSGSKFEGLILNQSDEVILRQFFPRYFSSFKSIQS